MRKGVDGPALGSLESMTLLVLTFHRAQGAQHSSRPRLLPILGSQSVSAVIVPPYSRVDLHGWMCAMHHAPLRVAKRGNIRYVHEQGVCIIEVL